MTVAAGGVERVVVTYRARLRSYYDWLVYLFLPVFMLALFWYSERTVVLAVLLVGSVVAAVILGSIRYPQARISDRAIEVKNFFGTERFDRASVDGLVVGGAPWSNKAPPALWLVIGDRHVYVSAFRGVAKADREHLAEVMLGLFADRCDGPGHIGLRDMEVFLDRFESLSPTRFFWNVNYDFAIFDIRRNHDLGL